MSASTPSPRADARASRGSGLDASVPLTRRELRAREQAALAAAPPPTVMSQQAPAPHLGSTQVAAPAPVQAASPSPAPPSPAPSSPAFPSSGISSFADVVAVTDSSTRRRSAPKKPKVFRPVGLPRGITRPRNAAPAVLRSRVAVVKRRPFKRRLLKKLMGFGAMIGAGLMMVATTIPANAFYSGLEQTGAVSAPVEAKVQSISVEPSADLALARDGYTATSFREQIFLKYGNRSYLYENNPNGAIQWPFPIAVPISDGYGYRIDNCGGHCSAWHKGVDFTPGAGKTIQAIADGVVSKVVPSYSGLGNHVVVDHQINDQLVQSVYAHMRDDSMKVVVGEKVKVGDPIGLVGSTGNSTGSHLHLEIHIGGEPIDPFEWLETNATPVG